MSALIARLEEHQNAFGRNCHFQRLACVAPLEEKLLQFGADWIDLIEKLADAEPARRFSPLGRFIGNRLFRPYVAWDVRQSYAALLLATRADGLDGPAARAAWDELDRLREENRGIFRAILAPPLRRQFAALRVHETRLKLACIALEVLNARNRTGVWPASVAELSLPSTALIDRCSGREIVLRASDEKLTIYALGFDADDDHGRAAERPRDSDSDGDIVLRLTLSSASTP
jgi:hypothetical protein